jgi:hypothetical protein
MAHERGERGKRRERRDAVREQRALEARDQAS